MNLLESIRNVASAAALDNRPAVEIEVVSDRAFLVRGEMPILLIGDQEFLLSRYPDNGDTHTLIFTLMPEEFARTPDGGLVTIQYGHDASNDRWTFGVLDKRS